VLAVLAGRLALEARLLLVLQPDSRLPLALLLLLDGLLPLCVLPAAAVTESGAALLLPATPALVLLLLLLEAPGKLALNWSDLQLP
jgi:hypothetical protein